MFSISEARKITDPVLRRQIEDHPRAQDLLRAFLYPYAAPDHDFLFKGGRVEPVPADDIAGLSGLIRGRVPVLAVGSNRAPVQLARKFSGHDLSDEVPVSHGWLEDHDIVYSTHLTRYGAVPATLATSFGTRVRVSVTWLDAKQLLHMHKTESVPAHYRYDQLDGENVTLDCGIALGRVGVYQSVAGHVFDGKDVFALSEIAARHRRFPALSQWDMIAHVARYAGQPMGAEFVLTLIDDPDLRKNISRRIASNDPAKESANHPRRCDASYAE